MIKIYDRSNKHFYKQKVSNAPDSGKNASLTKQNTMEEDEDTYRLVMPAVQQDDSINYGQGANGNSMSKFLGIRKKGGARKKKN